MKTASAPPVAVEPPPPPPVPQQQQQQQQPQPQQAVVAVPVAVPVQWTAAEVKAANRKLYNACWIGDAVAAAAALDGGAEVEGVVSDYNSRKPLHWAAYKDSAACITVLLDRGADVNGRDVYDHRTPLHWAVRHANTACATLLLDRGADVNALNKANETPLHYAAYNDQAACAQLLLDRGADPFIRTSEDKETPADWAQRYNRPGVLRVLTAHAIRPCLPAGVRELTDIVADYLLGTKPTV